MRAASPGERRSDHTDKVSAERAATRSASTFRVCVRSHSREGPSALCSGSRTVKNPAATDNINVEMSLDGLYHRPSGPKRNNMDKKKKTEHITASRLVSLRWHQNAAEISSFPKTILNHATFKAV